MLELNPEWSAVLAKLFSLQLIVAIAIAYFFNLRWKRGILYAAATWIWGYGLILAAQTFHHLLP
jgi:hypothetical protein